MLAAALLIIGLALQVIGIAVAAVGLERTWREHADSKARLRDELVKPYRIALQRAEAAVRKLLAPIHR